MTTKEKVKIFLDYKGISPTGLERTLGWGVGAFTKAKSITADRVQELLLHFPDLSAEWLFRDEGPMIKGDVQSKDTDRLNKLVDTIATLQDVINDKSASLAAALDRIKQLETQLKLIH